MLIWEMLPVYLLGNLHCIGMCGPLVMMLGSHPQRYWYFFGRGASFSLAGLLAGAIGAVVNVSLQHYQVPALASLVFGGGILLVGIGQLAGVRFSWGVGQSVHNQLSLLLLRNTPITTFLFGFCTVFLPCGQTLIVFSACAMSADPTVGLVNGALFAALTSPSLWLAMQASGALRGMGRYYKEMLAFLAAVVGGLAIARGLADLGCIDHCVLNAEYHVVLF